MWDIKYLIKDYLRSKSFQEFINHRWDDKPKIIFNPRHFKEIITEDGYIFDIDEEFPNQEMLVCEPSPNGFGISFT